MIEIEGFIYYKEDKVKYCYVCILFPSCLSIEDIVDMGSNTGEQGSHTFFKLSHNDHSCASLEGLGRIGTYAYPFKDNGYAT